MRQNGLSVFNLVPFVASFEMVDYMPKANTCWSIYDPQKLSCSSYAYYLLVWNFRKKIKIKGPSSSFLSWGINYTCFCGITFIFFLFFFFWPRIWPTILVDYTNIWSILKILERAASSPILWMPIERLYI